MKQIHCIVASLFTLLSFFSCEVDSGADITNRRTQAGYYIFDVVEQRLQSYINSLDMALKFDAYLQADEEKKELILKHLLPEYHFSSYMDTIYIESEIGEWSIVRASTDSLSASSSSWSMGFKSFRPGQTIGSIPFGGFTLTGNEQGNSWRVAIKGYVDGDLSEGSFEIKKLTDRKLHPIWLVNEYSIVTVQSTFALIDGNSYLDPPVPLRVKYQITKPFCMECPQDKSAALFIEGSAEMDIEQGVPLIQIEHVSAEIEQSNCESVTIHYRGITELFVRPYSTWW